MTAGQPSEQAVHAAATELMRDDPAAEDGTYGREDYVNMARAALAAAYAIDHPAADEDEQDVRLAVEAAIRLVQPDRLTPQGARVIRRAIDRASAHGSVVGKPRDH